MVHPYPFEYFDSLLANDTRYLLLKGINRSGNVCIDFKFYIYGMINGMISHDLGDVKSFHISGRV